MPPSVPAPVPPPAPVPVPPGMSPLLGLPLPPLAFVQSTPGGPAANDGAVVAKDGAAEAVATIVPPKPGPTPIVAAANEIAVVVIIFQPEIVITAATPK